MKRPSRFKNPHSILLHPIPAGLALLGLLFAAEPAMAIQIQAPGGSQAALNPKPRKWAWPFPGANGTDWVVENYVDLAAGPGIADYTGGMRTYDGHTGIDIHVPNFEAMDADFPVRAVERGFVVAVDDVHFDRNLTCTGQANFVTLQHPSGFQTTYSHLKQNSVSVTVGQTVDRGQTIAVVGSSGCSSFPHLDLETRNHLDQVVDPFLLDLWQAPPAYDLPVQLMASVIRRGPVGGLSGIADPEPNASLLAFGDLLGVGASLGGGGSGESVHLRLKRPDGTLHDGQSFSISPGHSILQWTFAPAPLIGTWTLEIWTNANLAASHQVLVGPPAEAPREARFQIPANDYQDEFNFYTSQGYRPVWFDGFDSQGATYFNVIFDKSVPAPAIALHNLTESQLSSQVLQLGNMGWRVTHLESYFISGFVRYALLAEDTPGPQWTAYWGEPLSTHTNNLNGLAGFGFRAVTTSALVVGGNLEFTALYDKSNVGGWTTYHGYDGPAFEALVNSEFSAGRYLTAVNAYDSNGTPRYTCTFTSVTPNQYRLFYDLSLPSLESHHATWESQGIGLRAVTAHELGATERFTACWKN